MQCAPDYQLAVAEGSDSFCVQPEATAATRYRQVVSSVCEPPSGRWTYASCRLSVHHRHRARAMASSARAMILITADRGGLITDYAERFLSARATGEQVVIDGACLSACTLVVGMLPRDKICATPKAVLGFHAAWRQGQQPPRQPDDDGGLSR